MRLGKITQILDRLLFVSGLFLLAFIPLYPKFPLVKVSGTFVAIRLEDILIALTVVIWIIYITLSRKLLIILSETVNRLLLVFFFIGALSLFSALFVTSSVQPAIGLLHYLRRIEFMMLMPIMITVINSTKRLKIVFILLVFVLLSANLYGLGQQLLDWPVISTTNSEFSKGLILRLSEGARVNSTFAGHYDYAVFLAMATTVMTAMYFAVKKRIKLPLIMLTGMSVLMLIMTAARLSFAAAFVGIVSALIFANKKKYLLLIFIACMIILIYPSQLRDRLVSTVTINLLNSGQRYEGQTDDQKARNKLNIPTLAYQTSSNSASTSTFLSSDITPGEPVDTTQLGVYRSFQIRINIEWPRAVNAFIKNPFLGTGYSSLGIATDNDFLRSIGEVGLLGTIAFALIILVIIKNIKQGLRHNDRFVRYCASGTLAMIVAFLVNAMFIDVFEASKVASMFWMVIGATVGVISKKS